MKNTDQIFLSILKASIHNGKIPEGLTLPTSSEEWKALLLRADEQDILPLIHDMVCRTVSYKILCLDERKKFQEIALQKVIRQIVQTNEFLTLLLHMQEAGLDPLVVKGIICRSLYPKPMLRPSVDEDLKIEQADGEIYHKFLLSEGLFADEPDLDRMTEPEWSYHKENSPTYIELHTQLFSPESEAYGDFNSLFENAPARAVTVQLEDVTVRTLHPTDHLLFLMCHSLKHFLHSGLGIRPVCDICLFIENYHDQIDWDEVAFSCEKVRMSGFAAGIFQICEKYLGLPEKLIKGKLCEEMQSVDETDLLEDILAGGLYGTASMDRMHSSTVTLQAVADYKEGKKRERTGSLYRTIFPNLASMKGRYPWLRRHPALLPAAWVLRICKYLRRTVGSRKERPMESVKIARSRVELLREYGVIE